ncbi:MAG: hypothetical protein AAF383_21135 [Cyanobacteria bacterium P01_A01_bin.83]
MSSKKSSARTFRGMNYRKVQRKNSRDRQQLTKENQTWLKHHNHRNIGWVNIIELYEKIRELQEQEKVKNLSLEELFIEADRIGNKYLKSKEINQRHQRIARELDEIANIIDSQYPDQIVEIIDYSK